MWLKLDEEPEIRFSPHKSTRLERWGWRNGLSKKQLNEVIEGYHALKQENETLNLRFLADPVFTPELSLTVRRSITSRESEVIRGRTPFELLTAALSRNYTEGDLRLPNGNDISILDIDQQPKAPVSKEDYLTLREKLQCQPSIAWLSKSGGLHLCYVRTSHHTARDLTCAAAIEIRELFPSWRLEILSYTRFPPGEVERWMGSTGNLLWPWRRNELSNATSNEQVEEWLSDHGLSFGRHDHTVCPFDPGPIGGMPPVEINPNGIKCYRCSSVRGSGWISWGAILGDIEPSRIAIAATHRVTWEHAKHIITEDWPSDFAPSVLSAAYRVLCVELADEPFKLLAAKIMIPTGIVRGVGNIWLNADDFIPVEPKVDAARLRCLPGVKYIDGDGNEKVSPIELDKYATNANLKGWTPIIPIRGIRLNDTRDPSHVYVVTRETARYTPKNERAPYSDCIAWLNKLFPGIDIPYFALSIAARAYSEIAIGDIPQIIVAGPSGSAKSTIPALAAYSLGDTIVNIRDDRHIIETIGQYLSSAGFLLVDEFGKRSHGGETYANLYDPFLNLSRDFTYRKLYRGPVTSKFTSVLIFTNTAFSRNFLSHTQAGRRVIYVDLTKRVPNWRESAGDIRLIRQREEAPKMLDSFISHVKDEHIKPNATWLKAAKSLNFMTMEEYVTLNTDISSDYDVIAFFKNIKYHKHRIVDNWIEVRANTEAFTYWERIADRDRQGGLLGSSERIKERDLRDTLRHSNKDLAIRFFSENFDAGIRVRIALTSRSNYWVQAANYDVLKECDL